MSAAGLGAGVKAGDGSSLAGKARRLARRAIPPEARLRLVLARRAAVDRLAGTRFAQTFGAGADFPHELCCYTRPFIIYAGQEGQAAAKRWNQALLAEHLDSRVIAPHEMFSIWRSAPRPTAANGYGVASAIREGRLINEVGGALCLLSTVLYNVGLLGNLEVIERHCHSVDTYGSGRYFELGRDAAIEYGYADLRLRNPHSFPVLLTIEVTECEVTGRLSASVPPGFRVEIATDEPVEVGGMLVIGASRRVAWADGSVTDERLPYSAHRISHAAGVS